MKAMRLRAVHGTLLAALLVFAAGVTAPQLANADGDELRAALDEYAAGRPETALQKLRAYVQSNPDQEEVYGVIRDVEHHLLLNAMAKGDEHETLVKYLLRQARPVETARMNDEEAIRRAVEQAVQSTDFDARRSAAASLRSAGALAVPHIVPHLASEDAPTVVNAIMALRQVHSDGTLALAEAMQSPNARVRMYAAAVLGQLDDDRAKPALEAASDDEDDAVRAKALTSLDKLGGASGSAADAYTALGRRFYSEDPGTVRTFSDTMNIWRWADDGITRTEVPAYLYGAQMAEECAADALAEDANNGGARALLVRSIVRQRVEADALAAAGEEAPASLAGATALARSLGFQAASDALGASIDGNDWDVAAACCDLVADTYGDESLEGSALSAALMSGERRVRQAAAIAALRMSPTSPFAGSENVASIAAQAAGGSAIRQVLWIDDVDSTRSKGVMALEQADYVVGGERYGAVGANRAKSAPTLDVVVIRMNLGNNATTVDSKRHASAMQVIDDLNADARTKDMRIIVLLDEATPGQNAALKEFVAGKYGDKVAGFLETPLVDSVVASEVGAAADKGDLGPDRDRANATAAKAAAAFSMTDNASGVFDLSSAVGSLASAATDGGTDLLKMNAVKALGHVRAGGADALLKVLGEGGSDEIKAAAASALGSVLSVVAGSSDQIGALMEAAKGEGDVASAAFAALGKVNNLSAEQRLEIFRQHRLKVGTSGN